MLPMLFSDIVHKKIRKNFKHIILDTSTFKFGLLKK